MSENPYQSPADPASPRPELPRIRATVFHWFRAMEPRAEMTPAERGMLYALYCLFGATPVWVIAFSVVLSSQLLVWLPLPYELVSRLWAVGLVGCVGLFYGLAYRVWRRRALKPLRELSLRIE